MVEEKEGEAVLEVKGLRKVFPGVIANDGIDIKVEVGQIHALLGENGAGKTTLVKMLYGVYRPDGGQILLCGNKVDIKSPMDARDLGIGMVHQHFMLATPNTVAENVALGLQGGRILFPQEEVRDRIREFSDVYGLKVDPEAKIWQLSAGEKQKIEILKALLAGARLLILDEPTAVLTPIETEELFSALRLMAEQGKAIIFITHKLDEVLSLTDKVTVLRRGKVVGTLKTCEINRRQLANMMVGVDVAPSKREDAATPGKTVLEVSGLCVMGDRGHLAVQDVTFDIKAGEILGIAGVAGNGQRELVEVLTGLRKANSGAIRMLGHDVINASSREISSLGVAYIPEDRLAIGVVSEMSVSENLILRKYWNSPFSKGMFLDEKAVENYSKEMISEYDIMTPSGSTPVRKLSGGNIQRLILARETSGDPKLIVASHPTSGLDVKAAGEIRGRLLKATDEGASVLLNSEDLDEIFELSDRIAVMTKGRIVGLVSREEATLEQVGLMMGGSI